MLEIAQLPSPIKTTYAQLSACELEVLKLIVEGYSNAAIATVLYISIGTVKTHVRNMLTKLDAGCRTQAVVLAIRHHLI